MIGYIYGVSLVSRIDKIIVSFAKEPYKRDDILQKRHNFKAPTNGSHPIGILDIDI